MDASDDGHLGHVLEPSSIGVGPAYKIQNGGPAYSPRELSQNLPLIEERQIDMEFQYLGLI